MNTLSIEQAQKLSRQYGGRYVGVIYKGRYRGVEWGTLLFVTESGFVFYPEDLCREVFVSWDSFDKFHYVSEPRSLKHPRYNKGADGRFAKKPE
ncbi:MAG: hypothetical protein EBT07_06725 [Actinobacteria bacterium]|nr:hypothetical protein [Actinomycetota bacterium]